MTASVTVGADGQSNPLRDGLPSERITTPCTIVFFGASGDLFKRMLLPAIYSMRLNGTLPADFALIGFSRTAYTDDAFRKYCFDQLMQFSPADQKPSGGMWDDFAKRISYITADFNDTRHFVQLKEKLEQNDADL
jgi:glucose-6-phosphate 1-dehydrogenase